MNALTVDVEAWFHVCGIPELAEAHWDRLDSRVELTTRLLLDLFEATGSRATFFVLGWVAERYPRLVDDIRSRGHQLGSHSHRHRRAYELEPHEFERDVRASVRAIEAASGVRVTCFRAPEWSINDRSLWALDVLAREGMTVDASMAPLRIVGRTDYPRQPHIRTTSAGPLVEVPPLVADRFGQVMPLGWGWGLRMSAPETVLAAVERANQAGGPAVLTIHPWEIDPEPPRVRLPAPLRFAHYFRLRGFPDRLRRILNGAPFGSLEAALSSWPSPSFSRAS